MKILLVIDSLGSGGAQRQLALLAVELMKSGDDITIFYYHDEYDFYKSDLIKRGVRLIAVTKKGRFDLLPIRKLTALVKQENFDTIISFLDTPNVYAILAKVLSFKKVPVIVSERSSYGRYNRRLKRLIKIYLIEQVYRLSNFVVANSYAQTHAMGQAHKWLKPKLRTVTNAVDTNVFTPQPTTSHDGLNNVLVVSRFDSGKNALNLVEALGLFYKQHGYAPNLQWVGKQDQTRESMDYRQKVERRVQELNLSHHWQWLGQRKDVPELMQKADVLIHPSLFEGFPNVICEAMSSGLPILASNIGDNTMLVEDGVHGFCFCPESIDSIYDSISRFVSLSSETVHSMRKCTRERAMNRFSIENFVLEYRSLCKELAKK